MQRKWMLCRRGKEEGQVVERHTLMAATSFTFVRVTLKQKEDNGLGIRVVAIKVGSSLILQMDLGLID